MTETPEVIDLKEIVDEIVEGKKIILFNDNTNAFEHVIACLIKYCRHTPMQSEQLATIAHFKGKVEAKTGTYEELVPICTALSNSQLTVEIQ